jgi:ribosomal protein L35
MKKTGRNSIIKRIRITKTGKVFRRSGNQGHNQAKQSAKMKQQKKRRISFDKYSRQIKQNVS